MCVCVCVQSQQLRCPNRIGDTIVDLFDLLFIDSLERTMGERDVDRETEREQTLHPGISRASPSASGTYPCSVSEPALLNMKR